MRVFFGGLLVLLVLVAVACNNNWSLSGSDGEASTSSTATSSSSTAAPRTASPPRSTTALPTTPPPTTWGVDPEQVTVSRIIDGDTFEISDGRRVRVLGIDSCEKNTPGGREATAATAPLQGGYVILTKEPGVDTDRDDRLLRYVQTGTGDFGEFMVRFDHTGVYQGDNDASDTYVRRLYAADLVYAANPPSGRECGQPDPLPPDEPAPDADVHVDTDDHDDDDGESWICRRRRWC